MMFTTLPYFSTVILSACTIKQNNTIQYNTIRVIILPFRCMTYIFYLPFLSLSDLPTSTWSNWTPSWGEIPCQNPQLRNYIYSLLRF